LSKYAYSGSINANALLAFDSYQFISMGMLLDSAKNPVCALNVNAD
jgi:hypothetical protein